MSASARNARALAARTSCSLCSTTGGAAGGALGARGRCGEEAAGGTDHAQRLRGALVESMAAPLPASPAPSENLTGDAYSPVPPPAVPATMGAILSSEQVSADRQTLLEHAAAVACAAWSASAALDMIWNAAAGKCFSSAGTERSSEGTSPIQC